MAPLGSSGSSVLNRIKQFEKTTVQPPERPKWTKAIKRNSEVGATKENGETTKKSPDEQQLINVTKTLRIVNKSCNTANNENETPSKAAAPAWASAKLKSPGVKKQSKGIEMNNNVRAPPWLAQKAQHSSIIDGRNSKVHEEHDKIQRVTSVESSAKLTSTTDPLVKETVPKTPSWANKTLRKKSSTDDSDSVVVKQNSSEASLLKLPSWALKKTYQAVPEKPVVVQQNPIEQDQNSLLREGASSQVSSLASLNLQDKRSKDHAKYQKETTERTHEVSRLKCAVGQENQLEENLNNSTTKEISSKVSSLNLQDQRNEENPEEQKGATESSHEVIIPSSVQQRLDVFETRAVEELESAVRTPTDSDQASHHVDFAKADSDDNAEIGFESKILPSKCVGHEVMDKPDEFCAEGRTILQQGSDGKKDAEITSIPSLASECDVDWSSELVEVSQECPVRNDNALQTMEGSGAKRMASINKSTIQNEFGCASTPTATPEKEKQKEKQPPSSTDPMPVIYSKQQRRRGRMTLKARLTENRTDLSKRKSAVPSEAIQERKTETLSSSESGSAVQLRGSVQSSDSSSPPSQQPPLSSELRLNNTLPSSIEKKPELSNSRENEEQTKHSKSNVLSIKKQCQIDEKQFSKDSMKKKIVRQRVSRGRALFKHIIAPPTERAPEEASPYRRTSKDAKPDAVREKPVASAAKIPVSKAEKYEAARLRNASRSSSKTRRLTGRSPSTESKNHDQDLYTKYAYGKNVEKTSAEISKYKKYAYGKDGKKKNNNQQQIDETEELGLTSSGTFSQKSESTTNSGTYSQKSESTLSNLVSALIAPSQKHDIKTTNPRSEASKAASSIFLISLKESEEIKQQLSAPELTRKTKEAKCDKNTGHFYNPRRNRRRADSPSLSDKKDPGVLSQKRRSASKKRATLTPPPIQTNYPTCDHPKGEMRGTLTPSPVKKTYDPCRGRCRSASPRLLLQLHLSSSSSSLKAEEDQESRRPSNLATHFKSPKSKDPDDAKVEATSPVSRERRHRGGSTQFNSPKSEDRYNAKGYVKSRIPRERHPTSVATQFNSPKSEDRDDARADMKSEDNRERHPTSVATQFNSPKSKDQDDARTQKKSENNNRADSSHIERGRRRYQRRSESINSRQPLEVQQSPRVPRIKKPMPLPFDLGLPPEIGDRKGRMFSKSPSSRQRSSSNDNSLFVQGRNNLSEAPIVKNRQRSESNSTKVSIESFSPRAPNKSSSNRRRSLSASGNGSAYNKEPQYLPSSSKYVGNIDQNRDGSRRRSDSASVERFKGNDSCSSTPQRVRKDNLNQFSGNNSQRQPKNAQPRSHGHDHSSLSLSSNDSDESRGRGRCRDKGLTNPIGLRDVHQNTSPSKPHHNNQRNDHQIGRTIHDRSASRSRDPTMDMRRGTAADIAQGQKWGDGHIMEKDTVTRLSSLERQNPFGKGLNKRGEGHHMQATRKYQPHTSSYQTPGPVVDRHSVEESTSNDTTLSRRGERSNGGDSSLSSDFRMSPMRLDHSVEYSDSEKSSIKNYTQRSSSRKIKGSSRKLTVDVDGHSESNDAEKPYTPRSWMEAPQEILDQAAGGMLEQAATLQNIFWTKAKSIYQ